MKQKFDADEWINLLLDGNLKPEQRKQLEAWLVTDPGVETHAALRRAKVVNALLKEIAAETPDLKNPERMWQQIRQKIEQGPAQVSWKERILDWFSSDRWMLPTATAFATASLVVALGYFWLRAHPRQSQFTQVDGVKGFGAEVSATSYDSKSANATVVWVSGFDKSPSQFGQIWQVYSFRPEVSATAYESEKGNATVIWISGLDDSMDPNGTSS